MFWQKYLDSNGKVVPYFPEIYFQDSNFNYSTLLATTSLNGLSVTLVDFLCGDGVKSKYGCLTLCYGTIIPFLGEIAMDFSI